MKRFVKVFAIAQSLAFLAWGMSGSAQPVSITDPANWITNTFTIPPGWSLIANPYYHNRGIMVLDAMPDNSVGEVLKGVPQGTRLFKLDNDTQRFSENRFRGRKWSNPSETLAPGEGAWIFNPTHKPFAMTFTGNCRYWSSVDVPAGWSLISSPDCGTINFAPLVWPPPEGCRSIACRFSGTNWDCSTSSFPCAPFPPNGWDNLSFNPQEGDIVYTFDKSSSQLQRHTFQNGTWDTLPIVGIAGSCFVLSSHPRTIRYTVPAPL
jgi:hypothetical protein